MGVLLTIYGNPQSLFFLTIGILLSTIGVRTRRSSLLSVGILTALVPYLFIAYFAVGWSGAPEKQIQISSAISSATIFLLSYLIIRRF